MNIVAEIVLRWSTASLLLLSAGSSPLEKPPKVEVPTLTGVSYAYEPDVLPEPTIIETSSSVVSPSATPPQQPKKQPTPYNHTPKVYTLRPVVALYRQDVIDQCKLVMWQVQPVVLAGHNHCGWHYLDNIPMGSHVVVKGTHEDGTYLVVGHKTQEHFNVPDWFKNYDLVLQTCTKTGLGFSLGVKIG